MYVDCPQIRMRFRLKMREKIGSFPGGNEP